MGHVVINNTFSIVVFNNVRHTALFPFAFKIVFDVLIASEENMEKL